jgi:hypothetical protein
VWVFWVLSLRLWPGLVYVNETILGVNTSLFVVSGAAAGLLLGISLVLEKTQMVTEF